MSIVVVQMSTWYNWSNGKCYFFLFMLILFLMLAIVFNNHHSNIPSLQPLLTITTIIWINVGSLKLVLQSLVQEKIALTAAVSRAETQARESSAKLNDIVEEITVLEAQCSGKLYMFILFVIKWRNEWKMVVVLHFTNVSPMFYYC